MESKAKDDKYLDEIIELEKKKKALDNVVYKMGQSTQTMHMLTKPQVFYDESHKTALGYQNPLYLTQAQRKVHALYCGNTIVKQHAALSVIDTEETFELAKESRLKIMEKSFLNEYSECVELKVELSKKNKMVEKAVYHELLKRCARMENRCISLENKVQQYKESFQNNQPRNNQDTPEFLVFFEINELKAQLEAKNNSISKLKDLATLKGKGMSEGDKSENISKVLTLGICKLDLEPLSPKLLRNREAHVDYLKYTQEHVDTLYEIVEHARALRPLDSDLESACNSTSASRSKPQGNTKKNRISRPTGSNKKNKVEDHIRSVKPSLNKKNHVSEPICNANVKHSVLNANSELIYATCNEFMFDAIHNLCVLDYVNDMNVRITFKSIKNKKKKVWKLMGKVFTNVGYSWKPTGRTFTIDGNTFPLTRITSITVVPPKKPISTIVVKKTPSSSNTLGKLKDITNVGSSSKSKNVEFKISNNSKSNKNKGSNVSTTPSSSRIHFRPFKLSSGTWTWAAPST
ncbi:hypothetical protein Tco_0814060 [Tanacetum coccineum]